MGLPFLSYNYRKRYGIIVGAIAAMAITFLSMFFVWEINITGNTALPEEQIFSVLRENGIYIGAYIPSIKCGRAATEIILDLPDLSSVSVVIKGTYITIDVIDRRRPIKGTEISGFGNIVAKRDGIIVSIEATSGKPVVKSGDAVCKGDLLISGAYKGFTEMLLMTRAKGAVYAKVYKKFFCSIPLNYEFKSYTGKIDKKSSLSILGSDINLFLGRVVSFESFDAEIVTERINLFGFIKTPIKKETIILKEYVKAKMKISEEYALTKAIAMFNSWCEEEAEGDISERNYTYRYDSESNSILLSGETTVLSDIGTEVDFDPLTYKFDSEKIN
ncbi:MAG: sporulation protein YqfD [Clostridia bacterium]